MIADEVEDGFVALMDKITRERSVPCSAYKPSCLRRRISVRLRARGVPSFTAYGALLDTDTAEWSALLEAMTINVTGFFRDASMYESLRVHALPAMLASRATHPGDGGTFTAWSAGCASGEEAWSLAMLMVEATSAARARVIATDIDGPSLTRARAGAYPATVAADIPDALRYRWCEGSEPVRMADAFRGCVEFRAHDMLREAPPASALDLVSCRNVIIYFARDAQEALFMRFADALRPGGLLVLGKVEMLSGPARARFAPVDTRERIYRRVA